MKYRLLRLLLFSAAIAWGVCILGVLAPWSVAETGLQGFGAGEIPDDPMLDYWLRMASAAFAGVGVGYLMLAWRPEQYKNVIGYAGLLLVGIGLVLLVHGLRLGLGPFPFAADSGFLILAGSGIWFLRAHTKPEEQAS